MKRSMTLADRFSIMYRKYCVTTIDAEFNVYAHNAVTSIMLAFNLTGFDGFSEMRAALNVFEYEVLEPADPAFCHSMHLVLNSLQMGVLNDTLVLDDDEE